jgi:hypothetical protein
MIKSLIDVDDVLKNMAAESVKRGEKLRTTVRDITLRALQTRELSLGQIKSVLRSVTAGVNIGAAGGKVDVDKVLTDALAGMDAALLKAVQASAIALQQLGLGGEDFEKSKLKKAVDDLDRLEDQFLKTVKQASSNAGEKIKSQWAAILKNTNLGGTETGAQAAATVEAFGQRMQRAMREQRNESVRTAYRLNQNFGTLASGVLIGLTEGLHKTTSSKSAAPKKRRSKPKQRARKSTKSVAARKRSKR